jgi:putative transposase
MQRRNWKDNSAHMVNRYNPDIHHRRSIRLKGYDYPATGSYFITICAHERECLFGEIVDGEMMLNEFGTVVKDEWLKSSGIRSEIQLNEYVVMPNHIHGIVCMVGEHRFARPVKGDQPIAPTNPLGPKSRSISALVAGFKAVVTKRINEMRQTPGIAMWQRNYYDHIIRNEADYNRIAEYVVSNPRQWAQDSLHPDAGKTGYE